MSSGRVALCHPPLTGTHFDPTIFSIFKKKWLFHIEPTSRYTWLMVHLPIPAGKGQHGWSRCVTGVRELRVEIGYRCSDGKLLCFSVNKWYSLIEPDWIKGFPCQKPGNALKPWVSAVSALSAGISFSGNPEKVIQKTRASSITNSGFSTQRIPCFQRCFRDAGWQNSENHKSWVPPSHPWITIFILFRPIEIHSSVKKTQGNWNWHFG